MSQSGVIDTSSGSASGKWARIGVARPETVPVMFLTTVARFPSRTAILRRAGNSWVPLSYQALCRHVMEVAAGLASLGLKAGDTVGLLSENRAEWVFANLACQLLGIVDVPVYPTLPPNQVEYILKDCGARVIFVSDNNQLRKIQSIWPSLPDLRAIIIIDTSGLVRPDEAASVEGGRIIALQDLIRQGADSQITEDDIRQAAAKVRPGDLCSVVYTSGTTGEPKGAMLSHWNFLSNVLTFNEIVDVDETDVFLSFLPLNHVFERLAGYYFPLLCGSSIAYPESALRVKQNLPEVQPTMLMGVPRLYDGLRESVLGAVAKAPAKQQKLFRWAYGVGERRARARQQRKRMDPVTSVEWAIADRLVIRKIRAKIGCSRTRYLVSGSAPMQKGTAEFLMALGITFLEGYGLTETSPVISVNLPDWTKIGSVGPAIPGVEISIADDGEILCRGPNIMQGYLNKPAETAEAIDPDGWFHTGDIGRLDEDGFLFITDRKKDLLVMATGKKVAPQPIEARLRTSPLINEIVLLGDGMSSCAALVVPDLDRLSELGREQGWEFSDTASLCALPQARREVRSEIEQLSHGLAEYERIRSFALVDKPFTVEGGELTPTLKVRRRVVAERYKALIGSLKG